MFLAIDSGNTTIAIAVMKNARVIERSTVSMLQSRAKIRRDFNRHLILLQRRFLDMEGAILCSVVPSVVPVLRAAIKQRFHVPVVVVGEDRPAPIANKYRQPRQVGQDRLVAAYAAKQSYGAPCIIVDLGTAITVDVVSRKGEYEGGMIIPGIRLSLESLHRHTALLPDISVVSAPRRLVGKDTASSILSGVFYGYGAMITGLVEKIQKEQGVRHRVILTGGYASTMKRFLDIPSCRLDPDLIFKGLAHLYTSWK
jgi:type III pantothenate kinase